MKFRDLLGNINYSTFPSGLTKLCNILRDGRKSKSISPRSGSTGQIFTEELSGGDSAGALRQGVIWDKETKNTARVKLVLLVSTFMKACYTFSRVR